MSVSLLERFEPSESYERTVRYAMTEASDRYRRDTARGLLIKAKAMRGEPVKRYRFALDAIHVLDKASSVVQPPLDPRNLAVLRDAAAHLLQVPGEQELATEVQATLRAIEQTTWPSFDELLESEYFQQPFDLSHVDGINAFEDWFTTVRPFFLLDLPSDDRSAFNEALDARIGWLKHKFEKLPKGDPFDWELRCIESLWIDANTKWDER